MERPCLSRRRALLLPAATAGAGGLAACAPEDVRGVRWDCAVSKRPFYRGVYTPQPLADGARLALSGEAARDAEPGSDIRALLDGYIAVNRLRCMAL